MPVRPWTLPIQELRWGRYISDDHTLIWIDWKGPEPRQWVFYNNSRIEKAEINNAGISFSNQVNLQISESHVIREGRIFSKIATSLTRYIPVIRNLIPAKFLSGTECKWLSKGTLYMADSKLSEGWIIHEVVQFNNIMKKT